MAFELPSMPSFQIQPPDVLGQYGKMLQLKSLLANQQFEQQSHPLQLQQQQQQVQAAAMENQMKQIQLQGQQALTEYWKNPDQFTSDASEFKHNDGLAGMLGIAPDDPLMGVVRGMVKAGVPAQVAFAEAKSTLGVRQEWSKATQEQQTVLKTAFEQLREISGPILAEKDANKKQTLIDAAKPGLATWAKFDPQIAAVIPQLHAGNFDAFANRLGAEEKAMDFAKKTSDATVAAQKVIPEGGGLSPEAQQDVAKQTAMIPGEVQKAVQIATNPQVQQGKVQVATAEGIARANVEHQVATAGQAALKDVPTHLVGPATESAIKAGTEYAQAKSVSDRLQAMMDAAKAGNVVSYQLIPQEGALQVTTSQGVHRINMAEIQNYGGGSLWQKLEGHIGKALTGESIPDSVLKDMEEMQKIQSEGARTKYENTLKTINQATGAAFKPVEMDTIKPPAAAAGAGKTLPMSAIEKAAKDHGVSVDEAKKQAQSQGYTVQ